MALRAKVGEMRAEATPVLLELTHFKRYYRMGVMYESGQIYRFTSEQAVQLLSEQDNGRAVWRVHRGAQVELSPAARKEASIVDLTERVIVAQPVSDDPTFVTPKRIEIGNDEEIESILSTGDIVTV